MPPNLEHRRHGVLIVDEKRCQGCQACMVACSLVHEGQVIPSMARLQVVLDPFQAEQVVHYCHQCRRAPCARACPHEAIAWLAEGGHWVVHDDLCVRCGLCADACPFGALITALKSGRVVMCDTCHEHPACVESCPTGALAWRAAKEGDGAPKGP
jgi:protein NrfC